MNGKYSQYSLGFNSDPVVLYNNVWFFEQFLLLIWTSWDTGYNQGRHTVRASEALHQKEIVLS